MFQDAVQYIPQRAPVIMVDGIDICSPDECVSRFKIPADSPVCCTDGGRVHFSVPGIIEHIAQSVAAFVGESTLRLEGKMYPGYIGEIRDFELSNIPLAGQTLTTKIAVTAIVDNVTAISASCSADDGTPVAVLKMKISLDKA